MSFSIIVCGSDGSEIERCWRKGNEDYLLLREGVLLGDLDLTSYDVFSSNDVALLVADLESAKSAAKSAEDRAHIEHIQALAHATKAVRGRTLVFTPFERPA